MSKIIKEIGIEVNKTPVKSRSFLIDADRYGGMAVAHVRLLQDLFPGTQIEFDGNKVKIQIPGLIVNKPLKGWRIAVDEGHGGSEPGAVDGVNSIEGDKINTVEAHLNDRLGDIIIGKLRELGAEVVVTRPGQSEASLQDRCNIANTAKAHLFLSIHFNAFYSSAHGVETYHCRGSSNGKALAMIVHRHVLAASGLRDRRVKEAGFWVLKHTTMPAILVEYGFITNVEEEKKITTDEYMQAVGQATVDGLVEFCNDNPHFKGREV